MMCLAVAAIAATAAAGVAQAGGQLAAGNANKRIADANAANLELSAKDADERARLDGEILRQQIGERIGQQRAGLSAANVDISRGSASNLSIDTAAVGELELNRVLNNAARESYGLRSQASITRAEGRNARTSGFVGAGTTLLTTASSAFGQAYTMKRGR